jgi:hypothetical protein
MLRLYRSLFRSEFDYDSFVYGCATKPILSTTDHVHNTGIFVLPLARSVPADVYLRQTSEPPLSLRRNLFFCGYAAKLAT